MSVLSAVEAAIKLSKEEQAKVNGRIHFYKDLRQSLTAPDEPKATDNAATDLPTSSSPAERREIKLLEQALEKALHVRTGREPPRNPAAAARGKGPSGGDPKAPKKPGISRSSAPRLAGGLKNGTDADASAQRRAPKSGKATASVSSSATQRQAQSVSSQKGEAATTLRSPMPPGRISARMWDKVSSSQRKVAPGRSGFVERMRATFPDGWPRGSPERSAALLGDLTRRVDRLDRRCRTVDRLGQLSPAQAGRPEEDGYSRPTLQTLQKTAMELRGTLEKAKQEWEAWAERRPEGVPFDAWDPRWSAGDALVGRGPPVSVAYASEDELRRLEAVRMRVALLQQETDLQQALVDALAPALSSGLPSSAEPSVLRDLYSLLGEGGQRFPAVVLDSDSD
ncbi:tubulin epsilon and delta complex protein 2 [Stigmatopora argus]